VRYVQFVWWPWRFGIPRVVWWKGDISAILDFSICLYPLEIRVWKKGVKP